MITAGLPFVSVCVCTFRRPLLLRSLLEALARQRVGRFAFEVVVVDNDGARSAEPVVAASSAETSLVVSYACEPEQNISQARNRAIREARGDWVAFLDDDEKPCEEWLWRLVQTMNTWKVDGVLGPVVPHYPAGTPRWVRRGGFFDRRRLKTGERISRRDGRTGNVLLRRSLFVEDGGWFDARFGRSGGEDSDFFERQLSRGRVFVWCDEAVAEEEVPPERWTVAYHLKRHVRSATIDGELIRGGHLAGGRALAVSAAFLGAGVGLLPASFVLPKHLRVRVWQKLAYSAALLAAVAGISILRERQDP